MREYMIAVYDVTDFTEAERDGLAGELDAQADRSEHHPSTGIVVGTATQAGDGVQHVGMFTEDDVEIGVVVKTSTVPTLDLRDSSAAFAGAHDSDQLAAAESLAGVLRPRKPHMHTDQAAVLNLISRSDGIGLRQIADELNASVSSVRRKVIGLLHQEKIVLDGDVYRPA
jgi:hypothetical protein